MNSILKLLFFVACFGMVAGCEKDEIFRDQDDPMLKKVVKVMVQPCSSTDVLTKAETDWQNINEALQNAGPGETVQLATGTFYLHKSVVCWNFDGTFRGSGMNETKIQTVPGELFDVSECPPIHWTFEENDGGFMFCFPQNFTTDERTVTVSDLSIVASEPTTPYIRWKNSDLNEPTEFNSLQAINVFYTNLDNDLANPIDLNVHFKNISIKGEKDEKYIHEGLSIFYGLAAFGLSSGTFEAKNVCIENASNCIAPYAFYGDDATVTVKNSSLKSCIHGIHSFLTHSWTIINNDIEDSKLGVVMLKQSISGEIPEGVDGISFVKNNRIHFEYQLGLGVGIQNVNNVEIKNNTFVGSSMFGGIGGAGAITGGENWMIKDNDFCGVVPQPPFNCTIWLNNLTNSEIKNNSNQILGGPGAAKPSNFIGEGLECN